MTELNSEAADTCLNCDEPLNGRFCHACGQDADRDDSFRVWSGEIFEAVTDLDSRILRTVVRAIPRPGMVARQFVAGKRESHVHPLRLFIVASAIVIPIMVVTGWFDKVITSDRFSEQSELLSVVFPVLNLFSPFIAALILKLLTPGTKIYHHLVLALYWGTGVVILCLPLLIDPGHWLSLIYQTVFMLVYSYFAIYDFFGFSKLRSFVTTLFFLLLWQTSWQLVVIGSLALIVSIQ